ncbi:hypothetical protein [Pseudomonas sp. microsymbiont 2]
MKYILFFIITFSTLWQLMFSYESWWHFALLSLLSVSWVVAAIYIYDLTWALTGRSSAYYRAFYSELKKDFFIALVSGLVLVFVINMSSASYSLSSIDIAFAGFPFLLMSIIDTYILTKSKIVGERLPRSITRLLMTFQCLTALIYIYFLIKINSTAYAPAESLWLQITLLLTAFCLSIFSHQLVFILKKQRMELSPALVELFDSMKMSQGIYKQAGIAVEQWNSIVFKKKAQQRSIRSRRNKKKR